MIVVRIEMWPGGDKTKKYPLGKIVITNDGTGTAQTGNYTAALSHAGVFYGKRREPFKRCRVTDFARKLSPYRLLCRVLKAAGEV